MTSTRGWFAAIAFASAAACGARSELLGGVDASGGAGPSSSASAGASSSAGGGGAASSSSASTGAGGGLPVCNTLTLVAPVASPGPPFLQQNVALTSAADDGQTVAAAFTIGPAERHVGFSPWTAWPADGVLEPVHETTIAIKAPPLPARSSSAGRIALLLLVGSSLDFLPDLDPGADGPGPGGKTAFTGDEALWLTARPPGATGPTHLAGIQVESRIRGLLLPGTAPKDHIHLGCGCTGASGGGVPSDDGWLAAFTSGAMHGCPFDAQPRFVKVSKIGADGSASTLIALDRGFVIALRAAAHPDGMYVVWAEADAQGNGLGRAALIGRDGSMIGPKPVAAAGVAHGAIAAATMGRRLALATQRPSGDIAVELYDESLALVSSTIYAPGGPFQGPTTALASPAGDQVLVGWGSPSAGTVRIARFDCGP